MGITITKLKGHIKPEDIYLFIHKYIDENVSTDIKRSVYGFISDDKNHLIKEVYDNSDRVTYVTGIIQFSYNKKLKRLFYRYTNTNSYDRLSYYSKVGLEDMVKSETTELNLEYDTDSVEIIKIITEFFSGWIDENDGDLDSFYWVEKTK